LNKTTILGFLFTLFILSGCKSTLEQIGSEYRQQEAQQQQWERDQQRWRTPVNQVDNETPPPAEASKCKTDESKRGQCTWNR